MSKALFMRMTTPLAVVLLLLVLSACVPIIKQTDSPQAALIPEGDISAVRQEVRKLIQGMLDEELVPGISLALVDRNGPIWLEGFGLADSKKRFRLALTRSTGWDP